MQCLKAPLELTGVDLAEALEVTRSRNSTHVVILTCIGYLVLLTHSCQALIVSQAVLTLAFLSLLLRELEHDFAPWLLIVAPLCASNSLRIGHPVSFN